MNKQLVSFSSYFSLDNPARLGIYCHDAGYTKIPPYTPAYPPEPNTHPSSYARNLRSGRILHEFQIIYIGAGKGWFKDENDKLYNVQAGDVIFLLPNAKHAYSPDFLAGWVEYWVGYSGTYATYLYEHDFTLHKHPIASIGVNQKVIKKFEEIIRLCHDKTPQFQVLLGALIHELFVHIYLLENQPQREIAEDDLIKAICSAMQLQVENDISVESLASEFGLEYDRFLDLYKRHIGLTPYQYFLQLRIQRAKELLCKPSLSIKEVAFQMNFDDQYYFSRFFKKKVGCSPSEWRHAKGEESYRAEKR